MVGSELPSVKKSQTTSQQRPPHMADLKANPQRPSKCLGRVPWKQMVLPGDSRPQLGIWAHECRPAEDCSGRMLGDRLPTEIHYCSSVTHSSFP